jgi:hypothetical protein
MAESTMVTSYPTWVQNEWTDMFDEVESLVGDCSLPGAWGDIDAEDYHGATPDATEYTKAVVAALNDFNLDTETSSYWVTPFTGAPAWDTGLGGKEDDLWTTWGNYDSPADLQDTINDMVEDYIEDQLDKLDSQIFPEAINNFVPNNTVFSSIYSRFVLDAYLDVNYKAEKMRSELTVDLVDKTMTRTVELMKAASARKAQMDVARADIAIKRGLADGQMQELKTKVIASANQLMLADKFTTDKAEYVNAIAEARFDLDTYKYLFEAMAALHGATPLREESAVSGWKAMSSQEKAFATIGTGVSILSGMGGLAKDIHSLFKD